MCKKEKNEFKYYLKEDGREIKIGDDIKLTHREKTPLGEMVAVIKFTVDADNIDKLVEYGYATKKKVVKFNMPEDWKYYAESLAIRLGFTKDQMLLILRELTEAMPAIAFQMLLKEIALYFERNDDTPIVRRKSIYVISLEDGKIYERPTKGIENFSTFSAFSSVEHAKKAKEILKYFFNKIYGKQEDC